MTTPLEPGPESEAESAWPTYEVVSENPPGVGHARESMVNNVWLVTCKGCGSYDIVAPGHPAMRDRGDGTHELHDRGALRHNHAEGCEPHPETGHHPVDFSFMVAPPAMAPRKLGIVGTQLLMLRAFALWRLASIALGMTDLTLANTLLKNLLSTTAAGTWNPTGGTSLTITPPLKLRLYTTTGTESASGTENTGGNSPGYTALGQTMGASAFTLASAVGTQNNQVQWTASGTWTLGVAGVEIWDSSGTPVRILWGALTSAIAANAVVTGDTVTFAASAISASGNTW
jgi:hypothetical protein